MSSCIKTNYFRSIFGQFLYTCPNFAMNIISVTYTHSVATDDIMVISSFSTIH